MRKNIGLNKTNLVPGGSMNNHLPVHFFLDHNRVPMVYRKNLAQILFRGQRNIISNQVPLVSRPYPQGEDYIWF